MKQVIKTYRAFNPRLFTLLLCIILPLMLIAFDFFTISGDDESIAYFYVVNAALITMAAFIGDYFTLNGIYSKNMTFKILKCSPEGSHALKEAIVIDMVRHFTEITVLTLIPWGITAYNFPLIRGELLGFALFNILVMFSAILIGLSVVRYFSVFYIYYLMTMPFTGLAIGVIAVFAFCMEKGTVDLKMPIIIAVIAVIVVICLTLLHSFKKIDLIFKE